MTDRPMVRITVDDIHDIDKVQVWSGGQWEEWPWEVIRVRYCWCGHSEGSHVADPACLGCLDDGCDYTCEHSSSHVFEEAEQYAPWRSE